MREISITIKEYGKRNLYPLNVAEVQMPLERFLYLLIDTKEAQKLLKDLYYKIDPLGCQSYCVYDPSKTSILLPNITNSTKVEEVKCKSEKEQIMDEWEKIINESIV